MGPEMGFVASQEGTRWESGTAPQRLAGTTAVIALDARRVWEATASRSLSPGLPASPKTCHRPRPPPGWARSRFGYEGWPWGA
ncbi:hypothetical protein GCM10010452_76460 [Crossiella cryophila]